MILICLSSFFFFLFLTWLCAGWGSMTHASLFFHGMTTQFRLVIFWVLHLLPADAFRVSPSSQLLGRPPPDVLISWSVNLWFVGSALEKSDMIFQIWFQQPYSSVSFSFFGSDVLFAGLVNNVSLLVFHAWVMVVLDESVTLLSLQQQAYLILLFGPSTKTWTKDLDPTAQATDMWIKAIGVTLFLRKVSGDVYLEAFAAVNRRIKLLCDPCSFVFSNSFVFPVVTFMDKRALLGIYPIVRSLRSRFLSIWKAFMPLFRPMRFVVRCNAVIVSSSDCNSVFEDE